MSDKETKPNPSPKPHGDHKLTLVLKTTAGQQSEEFNTSNKAQKVLEKAIEIFDLDPTPPRPYVLRREADGRTLALDEKLGELELSDGDVVLIEAGQATDG